MKTVREISKKQFLPVFLLLLLFYNPEHLSAQNEEYDPLRVFGVRYHQSTVIQHSSKLSDEITSVNPWIIETELAWHLRDKKTWAYCYCYPRTGFGLRYINFDNPSILGNSVAFYGFVEPYIYTGNKLNFSIRFGIGPAYLTKTFHDQENPENLFFSSPLSFIVLMNLGINYRVSDNISLRLAGDYNHISNGGYAEPNLGMNFPSLNLGIDYSFKQAVFPDYDTEGLPHIKPGKNRLDISYGLSFKPPSYDVREGLYPVHCFGFNYSRTLGRIFALSGGMEWINNYASKAHIRINDWRNEEGELIDHNRLGALFGIEWLFGKFIFSQHFGYYLYSPVETNRNFYQRYGLMFRAADHILTGISIKAHGQDANFIDVRLAFSLEDL